MKTKLIIAVSVVMMFVIPGTALALKGGAGGRVDNNAIFVTSDGLYYDTFVSQDPVPYNGHNGNSFQELYFVNGQPTTDYGPGDPGYKGGRWWLDLNGNDKKDPEGVDHYFVCPLFGPGE